MAYRPLLLSLFAALLGMALLAQAHAQTVQESLIPVKVTYFSKDAKSGHLKPVIQWEIRNRNQWVAFQEDIAKAVPIPATSPAPIDLNPDELIVFSDRDANGLSGTEIFLTPMGITQTEVSLKNKYFEDTNKMRAFLEDQRQKQAAFNTMNSFPITTDGIVVQYFIYNALPNPVWHVSNPDDVKLYEAFIKGAQGFTKYTERRLVDAEEKGRGVLSEFESEGAFMVYLNYPTSPATAIAVSKAGNMRVSNIDTATKSYEDIESAYFNFYRTQALQRVKQREEVLKQREKVKAKKPLAPQ